MASKEKIRRQFGEMLNGGGQQSNSPIVINSTKLPEPISMLITPTLHRDGKLSGHTVKSKGKAKPSWLSTPPKVLTRKIEWYHKDAERRCLADYANDNTHNNDYYCSCLPTEFRTYNCYNFPIFR